MAAPFKLAVPMHNVSREPGNLALQNQGLGSFSDRPRVACLLQMFTVRQCSRFVNIGAEKQAFLEFEEACDGFPQEGMSTWRARAITVSGGVWWS